MRAQMSFTKSLAFGAAALIPGLFMGGAALAQDASPMSTPVGPPEGYPVAVHEGTCDSMTSQPNYEIDNAVGFGADDSDADTIGEGPAVPVVLSASGTIDSSLDDLGNNGNAIAVHQSKDEYDKIVACGNIAGIKHDGKVVVALNSVDEGTVVGIAILDSDTSGILGLGDDQVNTTVYLFDTQDTGDATPAS